MDHLTDYRITKSHQKATLCEYHLEFALSDQQRYASQQIVNAIKARRKLYDSYAAEETIIDDK